MSYELTWHSRGEVLRLNLESWLSPDEMKLIDQQITEFLDRSDQKLTLLIDASAFVAVYDTVEQMRITQLYRNHTKLDAIIVVTSNKLCRLITLLVFHLSRARFVQFDNLEQAQLHILSRRNSSSRAAS